MVTSQPQLGGLVIGGEAGLTASAFDFIASGTGGIISGGASIAASELPFVASGGLVIGGEVDTVFAIAGVAGDGGLVIGGTAGVQFATGGVVADGGLVIGGEGGLAVGYIAVATGRVSSRICCWLLSSRKCKRGYTNLLAA